MALLAQWKLDETSGNVAYESVASANATYMGRWATSMHVGAGNGPGGSLADAGKNFMRAQPDYIRATSGVFNPPASGAWSFAAWVKSSDNSGATATFIDGRANASNGGLIYRRAANTSEAVLLNGVQVNGTTEVHDGAWHHILGVFSGSAISIYKDGVQTGTVATAPASWSVSGITIGGRNYVGTDLYMEGALADIRVYDSDESANVASIIDDARPTCSVSISGTAQVGQTLTATPLTNDSTATFEYQWYRADNNSGLNEAPISGATSSTYTAQAADEGKYLRCRGRSTNTGGAGLQSAYAYSAYSAQVTAGGGSHSLTATGLATGSPSVGSPALTQAHVLTGTGIAAGAPTLGAPALGQVHALAAAGIAAGAPVLGSPALSQAGELVADPLAAGAPTLGTPALSQHHVLAATGLATGAPAAGAPALAQLHVLAAAGVTAGAPSTGTPALAGAGSLTALDLATGPPALGAPQLTQQHALAATGVSAQPVLGAPALAQLHALIAAAVASGAPVLGAPVLVPDVNEVALVTPASRIHLVHSRNRTHEVRVRSRLHLVKRK